MLEFLLLLLPVAAATGWLAGRKGGVFGITRSTFHRPAPEYFRGLNYLLNEQPDKAIEIFIRMVEVDSETVETHLALGNLFRQRGEVDRAIRIHQNLVARPRLSNSLRGDSMLELARDYMSAGLLDRAESIFKELLGLNNHTQEACASLIVIYEREREWRMAIEMAKQLHQKTGESRNEVVAHYYCEMASEALASDRGEQAWDDLQRALSFDSDCARANIMCGDIALSRRDFSTANQSYRRAEQQDPSLVPVMVDKMLESLVKQGDRTVLNSFISELADRENDYSIVNAAAVIVEILEGPEAAEQFVKDELVKRPTLRGLHKWAEIELNKSKSKEKDKIRIIVDMLAKVIDMNPLFVCKLCGFKGKDMHWQCPGCKSWSTVKPITATGDE